MIYADKLMSLNSVTEIESYGSTMLSYYDGDRTYGAEFMLSEDAILYEVYTPTTCTFGIWRQDTGVLVSSGTTGAAWPDTPLLKNVPYVYGRLATGTETVVDARPQDYLIWTDSNIPVKTYSTTPGPPLIYWRHVLKSTTSSGTLAIPNLLHRSNEVVDLIYLKFNYQISIPSLVPDELELYKNILQFSLTLPETWRIKDMKEWEIQYAISSTNASWPDWETLIVLPSQQITHVHSNLDPTKHYRYRYQVRRRGDRTEWSEILQAGQPLSQSIANTAPPGSPENPLVDDSVTATKLANGAVQPEHISTDAGDIFIFPNEVRGTQLKATVGGIIFPDASVQTTAVVGDKNYIHDQNSAATDWTVNHNLGKFPSITVVDTGGSIIITSITHTNSNTAVVHFAQATAGKAYVN